MLSARISNKIRREVYRRGGYRCVLCDSTRYLQIHYCFHPSTGGDDTELNLITLCDKCHALAHGTKLDETD